MNSCTMLKPAQEMLDVTVLFITLFLNYSQIIINLCCYCYKKIFRGMGGKFDSTGDLSLAVT